MGLMDGKVCIVTGGAGSLGLASARLLLQEGAKVMLVDIAENNLKRAVEGLDRDRAAYCVADVTKTTDVKRFMETTFDKWGPIDVLFSNAGNDGPVCPITEYPEEVFDSLMAVHVRGSFLTCKYGLPRMRDGGSVIITSSICGVRGDPGICAYVTAKHALVGLMRTVAKEVVARRIRVNTINPGPVDNAFMHAAEERMTPIIGRDATQFFNEIIPLGRHAQPDEIARSVLYLASDQSTFTTGSVLMVDGGMYA